MLRLTLTPPGVQPAPCVHAPQAQPARHRRAVRTAAGGAVLERTVELAAQPPVRLWQSELDHDVELEKEFAEYKQQTQQMDELAELQAQLMASVAQMDSLLAAPQTSQEERKEKRKSSRQARKASTSAPATSKAKARSSTVTQAAAVAAPPLELQPSAAAVEMSTPGTQAPQAALHQPALPQGSLWGGAVSLGPSLSLPAPASAARSAHQQRASRYSSRRTEASSQQRVVASSSKSTSTDGTTQFMKSAGASELLVYDQQRELAAVVKDFLGLKKVEHQLTSILKRQPTTEEWAHAVGMDVMTFRARMMTGQQAKSVMVKANYRLVINVVKRYQNRGLSIQDLITEGMQGLLRGVEKYDGDKGFKFSTYAHWWIRQAVTRALQEQSRAVRLPTHIQEQIIKITAAMSELTQKLGRDPSLQELSAATQIPADKIPELLSSAYQSQSLETSAVDDDGGSEMKDLLADDRLTPDEQMGEDMIQRNMEEVLKELSPREAGVLRMHWGLDGKEEVTLEEIGAHFKITRERVRQIEAKAMQKLKDRQHKLQGIMSELQHMPFESSNAASRSSRGTKKT